MRNELQCLEDLAGMPKFVSICTIPFADGMLLEDMRSLLKDFTEFKHEELKRDLDAAFPDYFIKIIKKDLAKRNFDEDIIRKWKQDNPEPYPWAPPPPPPEPVAEPETTDPAAEDTGESTTTPVEGDGTSEPATEGGEEEVVPEPEPVKEPTLMKSQMTYKIQGNDVILSKSVA